MKITIRIDVKMFIPFSTLMRLFTNKVTGLYFDSKPWGTRSTKNEIITRAAQAFLPAKAKDFKIHFGYSKRKIMKLITVLIISLMFSSCVNKNLSDAEKFFGDSLRDKVEYLSSDEKWNDFNGNGFRVDIYEIKDLNYFKDKLIDKNFKTFNFNENNNPIDNTDYSKYIENGSGFYKTSWLENEIKTIVVNTTNNKFLYYYSLM